MRRISFVFPALAIFGAVSAQTFPPLPRIGTVYDGAKLLSASETSTLNALSQEFKKDTGAPIVVATFPSLGSVGARSMGIERYSTALFNHWQIGRRSANGGILVVVAKADRKARIELGADWKHDYDAGAHSVMRNTIVPAFKGGDYGGGIVRGCQALANLANSQSGSTAEPVGMIDRPSPDAVRPAQESSVTQSAIGFVICGMALPIIVIVAIVRALRRRGGLSNRNYGTSFGPGYDSRQPDNDPNRTDDDAFAAGLIAGQVASQPNYDSGPSYDSSSSNDSSSSYDSGSSDSGSSFDSGSSGGGGDTGSW